MSYMGDGEREAELFMAEAMGTFGRIRGEGRQVLKRELNAKLVVVLEGASIVKP